MSSIFNHLIAGPQADILWRSGCEDANIPILDSLASSPVVADRKACAEMVDGIILTGFKGFRKLEIPRLERFTLLGGGNNVGKTSVLEALSIYMSQSDPNLLTMLQQLRGLSQLPLDPAILWSPFFHNYKLSAPIVIEVSEAGKQQRLEIRYESKYVRKVDAQRGAQGVPVVSSATSPPEAHALTFELKSGPEIALKSSLVLHSNSMGLNVEIMRGQPIPGAFLSGRSATNTHWDALRFGRLDVQNKTKEILDIVKIVEPRLTSLSVVAIGNGAVIHGDIGSGVKMPVYYMGDGVVRILSIALAMATCGGGIVLIDEFGSGLHYSKLSQICEAVSAASEKYGVQVIGTTHSYELLNAAIKGLEKRQKEFAYIRIDRDGDEVVSKKYEYDVLGAAVDREWEVR